MSAITAAAAALGASAVRAEVVLGMLAPLVAAVLTWLLVERTYRESPLLVTPIMLRAMAFKIVWFAAYVTAMLKGLDLSPVPFVTSFTVYFVALHLAEAMLLHRLFRQAWHPGRGPRPVR